MKKNVIGMFLWTPLGAILLGIIALIIGLYIDSRKTKLSNRSKYEWEYVEIVSNEIEYRYHFGKKTTMIPCLKNDSVRVYCLDEETMYYLSKDTLITGRLDSIIITDNEIIFK